jgi:hypothetical protein
MWPGVHFKTEATETIPKKNWPPRQTMGTGHYYFDEIEHIMASTWQDPILTGNAEKMRCKINFIFCEDSYLAICAPWLNLTKLLVLWALNCQLAFFPILFSKVLVWISRQRIFVMKHRRSLLRNHRRRLISFCTRICSAFPVRLGSCHVFAMEILPISH